MHILNIRFQNLNSLAGEWFIDFERPEYQGEGAFLITGQTGAGKTTILDAICLALYGRTPRLELSQNSNEIMTRHTDACFAEITFETSAGRFMARWEQRRTRRNANSPFQQPKRSLWRANGEIVAEKLSEVDREIKILTGLDYAQFTRAIMLAQGDFDAFLKAKPEDRAQILERLTDTSIFREISRFAHDKDRRERERLEVLKLAKAELGVLDADVEKRLQIQEKECELCETRIETDLEICAANIIWLENINRLRAENVKLKAEERTLAEEEQRFAPRLLELEQAQKAAPLEDKFLRLQELRANCGAISENLRQKKLERKDLEQRAGKARQSAQNAAEALEACEQEAEAALPRLTRARLLDMEISRLQDEQAKALYEKNILASKLADLQKSINKRAGEAAAKQRKLAEADKWLDDRFRDEWLVENLADLKTRLISLEELQSQERMSAARHARNEEEMRQLDIQQRDVLAKVGEAAQKLADSRRIIDDLTHQNQTLQAGSTIPEIEAHLARIAQKQLERVKLAHIQDYRHLLEMGKPCPLCGSLDHPWQAEAPNLDDDELEIQRRELEKLLADIKYLEKRLIVAEKEATGKQGAKLALEMEAESLEKQRSHMAKNLGQEKAALRDVRAAIATRYEELAPMLAMAGITTAEASKGACKLLDNRLLEWRNMQARKAMLQGELRNQETELAIDKNAADHLNHSLLQAEVTLKEIAQKLKETLASRFTALGDGKPAEEENRLRKSVDAAKIAKEKCAAAVNEYAARLAAITAEIKLLENSASDAESGRVSVENSFAAALMLAGMDERQFMGCRHNAEFIREIREQRDILLWRKELLATKLAESEAHLRIETAKNLTSKTLDLLRGEAQALKDARKKAISEKTALAIQLAELRSKKQKAEAIGEALQKQTRECEKWGKLKALIGSSEGKKFSTFAQNVTLDILLRHANRHLAKIMDRYRFQRCDKKNMNVEVTDGYQGGVSRSISSLSGGETFIASLALSLGLSSMAGSKAEMGSLFLDEGFGTLDPETLYEALDAIASLKQEGKLIGVISHVEAIRERIATHIHVVQNTPGRSVIRGPGCERK